MLSNIDLANMRTMQAAALPSTAALRPREYSGDGIGGKRESWAGATTTVPCRLAEMSKETRVRWADKLGTQAGWVVTMAYDQSVVAGDHIIVADKTYTVLGTNAAESWQTALRAYCMMVK